MFDNDKAEDAQQLSQGRFNSMFPFGNSRFVPAMAGTNLPF